MNTSLKGKVAWITGGGSGIGLAGALELARAGAHVVISGRTAATNQSGLAELKKAVEVLAERRRPTPGFNKEQAEVLFGATQYQKR